MTTALTMVLPWLRVKGPGDRQLSPPPCTTVVRKALKAGEILLKKKKKKNQWNLKSIAQTKGKALWPGWGQGRLSAPPPQFQENIREPITQHN